jgi:hypothetical protein
MVLYFRGKLTISVVMTSALILVLNAYQIAYVALTISKRGVDYYHNDASIAPRLVKMVAGAFKGGALAVSTIACFTALIIISYQIVESKRGFARTDRERFIRMFISPLLMVIMLAGFHFFNLYVYNGKFYLTHRYAFPSVLVAQILFLLFICWVYRYYCISHPSGPPAWFRRAANITILPFLIYFVGSTVVYSQQMSEKNVVATTRFQAKLAEIVTIAKQHPDYAIVFYSYDPVDSEPLISVATYLRYYSVQNKLMLKTNYAAIPNPQEPMRRWNALENVRKERSGDEVFSPNDGAWADPCLGIDFSGDTKDTKCMQLGKVWNLGQYPH